MSVIDKLLKFKTTAPDFCSAVVLAAGNSQRMGKDKVLMPIGGAPVIAHTLKALQSSDRIDEIVIVTKYESIQEIADICNEHGISKASRVIRGGTTRLESALIGVSNVSEKSTLIAIHDGARPFVTEKLIDRVVHAAKTHSAAAPAVTASDTVRLLNSKGAVTATPDRDLVALVQTPQVFLAELIKAALTRAMDKGFRVTDDCSAVEAMGYKVTIVAGEADNIKLTTTRDIYAAEGILAERRGKQ